MTRTPRARTSQHHAPRQVFAAVLAAATLIVGCGPSASGPEVQAAPTIAEQWSTARDSAQRQGVENLVSFYDPDLVVDHRALGSEPITGRAEALEYLNAQRRPFHDSRTPTGRLYLSADAALSTEAVGRGGLNPQIDAAVHATMGPSGADSETIAASLVSWRTHDPGDERSATVQALAQDYVRAWSREDADSVRVLYQPDAVVTDSLAGVTARGAAQIADLAGAAAPAGGLGAAVVDQLPDYRGPAVYADPVLVQRTGTLDIGGLEVEVYNGTPGLEGLITWSFAQFRAHGLGTPTVRRATFHNNQTDRCKDVVGLILGDAVILCFDSTTAACQDQDCTTWRPWAKQTTLHELAHAWMDEHLTPEAIEQFQTATGMPTWSDPKHPWGQRGVELAAETIAWATSDQPVQVNPKLGSHTCDDLARYYQILTSRPPEPTPPGCEPTPAG